MPRSLSPAAGLAAWVLLALLAGHDVTHAVDEGLETDLGPLALVAIPQWIAIGAVMWFVLRGDAVRSRLAALALGLGAAVGVVLVHLVPFAPNAYADLDPSPASWVLAWAPIGAGLVLAALALRPPTRDAGPSPAA